MMMLELIMVPTVWHSGTFGGPDQCCKPFNWASGGGSLEHLPVTSSQRCPMEYSSEPDGSHFAASLDFPCFAGTQLNPATIGYAGVHIES
jgi:hypothetical protein